MCVGCVCVHMHASAVHTSFKHDLFTTACHRPPHKHQIPNINLHGLGTSAVTWPVLLNSARFISKLHSSHCIHAATITWLGHICCHVASPLGQHVVNGSDAIRRGLYLNVVHCRMSVCVLFVCVCVCVSMRRGVAIRNAL